MKNLKSGYQLEIIGRANMRGSLESKYIQHLDETYFRGYAKQLYLDNEKLYYRGMKQFLNVLYAPDTCAGGF